jgi:hypothetical protein
VSQVFGHTFGSPRSLTEPDKRLSHTSGSSVNPSDRLYSTTWIQVFANNRTGPFIQFQYFLKPLPCIAWPLTLAIDLFNPGSGLRGKRSYYIYPSYPSRRNSSNVQSLAPCLVPSTERFCVGSVLKTGQKVIGKTKIIRLAPATLFKPSAKPQVQCIVQVDVGQQR